MRKFLLARYIIREHLGPFIFAFFVITLFFLLNLLFRELSRILSKGLPWYVVLEFFLLNMAWIVALAVPMAMLTATLMAFGRFSADSEIAAMEATGVSIWAIVRPALFASAMLALALIWFNNNVLPDFNHRTRLLANDIGRKRPTINIEPGVWYDDVPNFGLLVQELEDSANVTKARNLLLTDYSSREQSRHISARRGYIALHPTQSALVLTLFDGEMQEIDYKKPEEFRRIAFPRHVFTIVVDGLALSRSDSEYRGDREKSAAQMRSEVASNEKEIRELRSRLNTTVALSLTPPLARVITTPSDSAIARALPVLRMQPAPHTAVDSSLARTSVTPPKIKWAAKVLLQQRQLLNYLERDASMIDGLVRKNQALTVEVQKKYSIPVACIVFVLIGAPLGIMSRRAGLATGGGLSLIFFLLYWTFLVGGEDLADREIISPFLAMWSANIVVGMAGLYFLWRATYERTALNLAAILKWFVRRKGAPGSVTK
ncbi:MAG: LptF/LptG family permease [candidate division KSB1 bacterium]